MNVVPVFASKFAKGWPEHVNVEQRHRARYKPLVEAFTDRHSTDAHFATYSVPNIERRLATEFVFAEIDAGIPIVLFVIDIEPVGHAPVTVEWWSEERAKIERLLAAHPAGLVYRTRGGYRIVYRLGDPVVLRSPTDAARWKLRYLAWLSHVESTFGIIGDPSCQDWTRLYRLPFVVRDGERQEFEVIGDASAIGTWDVEVEIVEPENPRPRAPTGTYSPRPGAFDIYEFMRTHYPSVQATNTMTAVRWDIECPWQHEHSSKAKRESSVFAYPSGAWDYQCLHSHCKGVRGHEEFRRWHDPTWVPFDERPQAPRRERMSEKSPPKQPHLVLVPPAGEPPPDDIPPPGDDDAPKRAPRGRPAGGGGTAVMVARQYIEEHQMHYDGPTLRRWRGEWYLWSVEAGCYEQISNERVDSNLYRVMGLADRSEVGDVRHALIAVDDVLIDKTELGAWIDPNCTASKDAAICINGMVDLATGELSPATPAFFATTCLGVSYDPSAPEPKVWKRFLDEIWPEDPESIATMQEWFGYLLTNDTRQQKILMLIGDTRSGKGTIMRTQNKLLGKGNVASPTLTQFGTNFGMWPLIGKPAAVVADARVSSKTDIAPIVERLLSISGEDTLTIDRKNLQPWTGQLPTRITIVSNELPVFTDASDAIVGRMLLLELNESFLGREDPLLAEKLEAELPGILLWAIEGWRRLRARGRFVQPKSGKGTLLQLSKLASTIKAWASERCVLSEQCETPCREAYQDFCAWCHECNLPKVSKQKFGRDLKSAFGKRIAIGQVRSPVNDNDEDDSRPKVYRGIGLLTRVTQ